MRRDTANQDSVSQLRTEVEHYHRRAEGQSDEFQQSQAQLRQKSGAIKNRSGAVKESIWRDQNCERQYCTRSSSSSSSRSRTIHQNLHDVKWWDGVARTVAESSSGILGSRLFWIKFRSQTVRWKLEIRNWRSHCRRRTSNSVDYRLKFLSCEHRWSGINLPKIETQKIFEIQRKKLLPWLRTIFGNQPRFNDSFSAAEKLKQRVFSLHGKTRKMHWTIGVTPQKNCAQQVSGQEILLNWLLETHLSPIYEISQSRAQFLLQHSDFHLRWLEETPCKVKHTVNLEEQEKYLRSHQPEETLRRTTKITS